YRATPLPESPAQIASPRLARRVLLAVLLIQCVLVTINLALHEHKGQQTVVLSMIGLGMIVALQVIPPSRIAFLAQSALFLVPLTVLPGSWDRLLSYFTGGVLLRVRPPWSWLIVGMTLAWHAAYLFAIAPTPANALANIGGHVMLMWLVYSLGRLTELATLLERARYDLAEAAIRRERARIARDLHDVIGYSLSAVALKGEVAERLLDTDPERATTELDALVAMVEQTMAELDSIVVDRVELSWATEIDAAGRLLESAGIHTRTRVQTPRLTVETDTA
ncbi:histidine kinase, partial [Actinomadura adrarensis]